MNTPKAQFQVDHGFGWETIAEVDIIDGVAQAPNAWTMVRALGKRIVYTGYVSEEITVVPSLPRDTHFAGFAKQLYAELVTNTVTSPFGLSDAEAFKRSQHTIIARRAYDLAVHILDNRPSSAAAYEPPEVIKWIPDLMELPEGE